MLSQCSLSLSQFLLVVLGFFLVCPSIYFLNPLQALHCINGEKCFKHIGQILQNIANTKETQESTTKICFYCFLRSLDFTVVIFLTVSGNVFFKTILHHYWSKMWSSTWPNIWSTNEKKSIKVCPRASEICDHTVDGRIFAKMITHFFLTSFEILDMSNNQNIQFSTRNPIFRTKISKYQSQKAKIKKNVPKAILIIYFINFIHSLFSFNRRCIHDTSKTI